MAKLLIKTFKKKIPKVHKMPQTISSLKEATVVSFHYHGYGMLSPHYHRNICHSWVIICPNRLSAVCKWYQHGRLITIGFELTQLLMFVLKPFLLSRDCSYREETFCWNVCPSNVFTMTCRKNFCPYSDIVWKVTIWNYMNCSTLWIALFTI